MGCAHSSADDSKRNEEINKQLHDEQIKNNPKDVIKLLLLGAGESGKSTIAKQIKLIHLNGFTNEERISYRLAILNNAIGCMRSLIRAADDMGTGLKDEASAAILRRPEYEVIHDGITPEMVSAVQALWKDPGIHAAYDRRAEFQLLDCAAYFFDHVERISKADYVPTVTDILTSRIKTSGVSEMEFTIHSTHFKLVDVGGQRSERKKWMNCFPDVTAVLFVVALSEYDQKLYEDGVTNRMTESMKLWKETCNNKFFMSTPIILFLNKSDLFKEKLPKSDLSLCFPDYKAGNNFDAACDFIRDKFFALLDNSERPLYCHITCATDTNSVQVVFNAVTDIIIRTVLQQSGV